MSEPIRGIEPNRLIHFANALRKGKDFLNKGSVGFTPTNSRIGFGDLFLGEAPETLEDMSYGFMPWTGSGKTLRLDPGVADIVALPTFGAAAGSKALINRLRKPIAQAVAREAAPETVDQGRRGFLKGMGAATVAGAASTSILPDLLRKELPKAVPKAAARVAGHVPLKSWFSDQLKKRFEEQISHFAGIGDLPHVLPTMKEEMAKTLKKFAEDPIIDKRFSDFSSSVESKYSGKINSLDAYKRMSEIHESPEDFGFRSYSSSSYGKALSQSERELLDSANAKLEGLTKEEADDWILLGKRPDNISAEEAAKIEAWEVRERGSITSKITDDILDPHWALMMENVY